ncbi:hypothetical protein [Streptomyces triticirhizae]|uniref:Uncharacterized protein n=1 Tax=Streptomyces triticirhizae TaxID=2483353 RepID=A0A3M2LIT6_9ACTN|nr:hypothetical protein [Streptomyces triticirhizae]RMI37397.1 hypothetical protein EBN88_19115 [Streptomyces triticirhizae]
MGWTVLYIAFGFVALWLLGEVLLQYKARLRWRLVAFFGFLGVVVGVLLPSVPVIALGAVAFATGQTFVTLSFRRGFSTGWALGGKPGTSRRRREPRPENAGDEGEFDEPQQSAPPPPPAPTSPPDAGFATEEFPRQGFGEGEFGRERPGHGGYDSGDYPQQDYAQGDFGQNGFDRGDFAPAATGHDGFGPNGFPQHEDVGGEIHAGVGYDAGYADGYRDPAVESAYTEPYPGAYQDSYGAAAGYGEQGQYLAGGTDGYGYQTGWAEQAATPQAPEANGYGDPAGGGWAAGGTGETPYYQETPPGGVWVPQQREGVADDPLGYGYPQQPADPYGQPPGYDATGQGFYYDGR